jgi:hypothetical protein
MEDLPSTLESYGADPHIGLRLLGAEDPGLLPYATLVAARNTGDTDLEPLLGVYEWQSSPLVFSSMGMPFGMTTIFAVCADAWRYGVMRLT